MSIVSDFLTDLCEYRRYVLTQETEVPGLPARLTLYGHIKTAEQRTVIQQYGDWYTGR